MNRCLGNEVDRMRFLLIYAIHVPRSNIWVSFPSIHQCRFIFYPLHGFPSNIDEQIDVDWWRSVHIGSRLRYGGRDWRCRCSMQARHSRNPFQSLTQDPGQFMHFLSFVAARIWTVQAPTGIGQRQQMHWFRSGQMTVKVVRRVIINHPKKASSQLLVSLSLCLSPAAG